MGIRIGRPRTRTRGRGYAGKASFLCRPLGLLEAQGGVSRGGAKTTAEACRGNDSPRATVCPRGRLGVPTEGERGKVYDAVRARSRASTSAAMASAAQAAVR